MAEAEHHVEQLALLGEILLGVAYADGRFQAEEADTIREILAEFANIDELPPPVRSRIADFEPAAFDISTACSGLDTGAVSDRQALLGLILRVADADRVLDPGEEHYIFQVARAIGAERTDVDELLGSS